MFKEINLGVKNIKPAEMEDSDLMYEKDICPGACHYIVSALREKMDDISFVKRMLSLLLSLPFNNKCISYEHS